MFGQLGQYRFELTHYFDGIETTKTFGFAEHARVEGKAKLQAVGDGLDIITLDLRFHSIWCDVTQALAELEDAWSAKEAMTLVMGDGTYRGRFVVTDVVASHRHCAPNGATLWADLRLTLKEWVDDNPQATAKRQRIAKAPGRKKVGQTIAGAQRGTPPFTANKATSKEAVSPKKIARQA
jgi:phage protein U